MCFEYQGITFNGKKVQQFHKCSRLGQGGLAPAQKSAMQCGQHKKLHFWCPILIVMNAISNKTKHFVSKTAFLA